MSITWILVANTRLARLYAHHGPNLGLELVEETEAISEEFEKGPEAERASRPSGTDKRQDAARGFAHRLAQMLYRGRSRGDYERAILVAPPGFMGLLNAELDRPTAQRITGRLDKDYTRAPQAQLKEQLAHCLCV